MFKIKDLGIAVLPKAGECEGPASLLPCLGGTLACPPGTLCRIPSCADGSIFCRTLTDLCLQPSCPLHTGVTPCIFPTRNCLGITPCPAGSCWGPTDFCGFVSPCPAGSCRPPSDFCGFVSPCPAGSCRPPSDFCGFVSPCPAGSCIRGTGCPGGSCFGGSLIQVNPAERVLDLQVIKAELQRALQEVDALDEEAQLPQSIEQVDELQKKLREALGELDSRRQTLAKRKGAAKAGSAGGKKKARRRRS